VAPFVPPPSVETQKRELGRMIAAARTAAGLTQGQLARLVSYTQANISKYENARLGVPPEQLKNIIKALEVDEPTAARMNSLNEASSAGRVHAERRLNATPQWFREVVALEAVAAKMYSWTGERMPGLLQSESYMLEQFQAYRRADVDDAVFERKSRARIFANHPDRTYKFVLSQSAIERLVRSRTENPFMALDQLKHMLQLAERYPSLVIRVVPFEVAVHVDPDFTILQFDHAEPDFAYSESAGGVHRSKPDHLTDYLRAWAAVSSSALSAQASLDLLRSAAARCERSL
jgi:transcriptional regulator with XRE-family HTH domain